VYKDIETNDKRMPFILSSHVVKSENCRVKAKEF